MVFNSSAAASRGQFTAPPDQLARSMTQNKTPEARCLGRCCTACDRLVAAAADVVDAGDVEDSAANPLSAQLDVFAAAKAADGRAAVDIGGDETSRGVIAQPDGSGAVVDAVDHATDEAAVIAVAVSAIVLAVLIWPTHRVGVDRAAAEDAAEGDRDADAKVAAPVAELRLRDPE